MHGNRSVLADWAWHSFIRPLLFLLPAESAHDVTMRLFSVLMLAPGCRWLTTIFRVADPRLRVRRFGLEFPSPVGLAAGLDKNAVWCNGLQALGFGFIEVGT